MSVTETDIHALAKQAVKLGKRAFKANRPMFVLVSYDHEGDKIDFLESLRLEANEQSLKTRRYDPKNNPENSTTHLYNSLVDDVADSTLSIVTSVPLTQDDNLEPEFLTYLNLHRDKIVEHKLHFLLCLRSQDMADFIDMAGDLWSFRHKTLRLERTETAFEDTPLPRLIRNSQSQQDAHPLSFLNEEDKAFINQAQSQIAKTQQPQEKAQLMADLAHWLERRGASRQAIEIGLRALNYVEQETQAHVFIELLLGTAFQNTQNYAEALTHLTKAQHLAQKTGEANAEVAVLRNMASIYEHKFEFSKAKRFAEQALSSSEQLSDPTQKALILGQLSKYHIKLNEQDKALARFEEATKLSKSLDNVHVELQCLETASFIYDHQRQYKKLQSTLKKMQALGQQHGLTYEELQASIGLAYVLYKQKKYQQATALYHQALQKAKQLNEKVYIAIINNTLGHIHRQKGEYDAAIACYQESVNLSTHFGSKHEEFLFLNYMAMAYRDKHSPKESLECLTKALKLAKSLNDTVETSSTLMLMAEAYIDLGQFDNAQQTLDECQQLAQAQQLEDILEQVEYLKQRLAEIGGPTT